MLRHNVAGKENQVLWKVVDGDGHDEQSLEGELFDSYDEAKEECDRLHTKYDIDTDIGYGSEQPWFVPEAVQPEDLFNDTRWTFVKYRKDS